MTALIPVFIGGILLVMVPGVKKEAKIPAHVAVLLTLVVLIGFIPPLMGVIKRGSTIGARVSVMIFLYCFSFNYFYRKFYRSTKKKRARKEIAIQSIKNQILSEAFDNEDYKLFFSFVFAVVFYLILLIFHVIQWIALKFGYQYHKISVDWLNWFLMKSLLLLGNTVTFKKHYPIPRGVSIIFISNHQSMFDIPPIIWHMRKYHPKFVSKIELGRGIPSVSFNLRHGGAALINRKDPKQSLSILENFGKTIDRNTWSAVIFPEGTRSRNGQPKKICFKWVENDH